VQSAGKNTSTESYRLGIYPYMPPRQTVELYGPVAVNFQTELDHTVKLESLPSFPDFMHGLKKYQFDIAFIQPFDYPEVVEKLGYIPLAQLADPLVAQLFVRDDSPYQNIEDLRGTRIAMPPKEAATSRLTLRALYDNHLIPGTDVEVHNFNSHDSCIQQVWAGTASACGTAIPPVLIYEHRMQAKLRAIYNTPAIPHALFVASPHIAAAQRAKLQQLITGWSNTDSGRSILKHLGFPGFVVPKLAEYKIMRHYDPTVSDHKIDRTEKRDLLLGVFPYLNARQIAKNYAPALPSLSKAIGKTIHLQTATNYVNFNMALSEGKYDIVVVQPLDYAKASMHGYMPLAGMKNLLWGEFYVLNNSPYQHISDLKNHIIAMPDSVSAISHVGRYALLQAELNPDKDVTIDYRRNHDSCLQQVQSKVAAACVTSPLTMNMLPHDQSLNLHSIKRTLTIPGSLFMANKRLSAKNRNQLNAEIKSWKDSKAGRKILDSIGFGELDTVNVLDYLNLPKI
jgi:phosphonate transport system substrate-binding protein